MKRNLILLSMFCLILVGCAKNPTESKVNPTNTPYPTPTMIPLPTATPVPQLRTILYQASCNSYETKAGHIMWNYEDPYGLVTSHLSLDVTLPWSATETMHAGNTYWMTATNDPYIYNSNKRVTIEVYIDGVLAGSATTPDDLNSADLTGTIP
jgi:hypothetical protein